MDSSVISHVSELFHRGPIGNSAASVQVVAWHRTDAKPYPKPNANVSAGFSTVSKVSPIKPIISIHFLYIYTNISRPQRPHVSKVHWWIDKAHVFSAFTVNPGPHTGDHSDILTPLADGCERCDWSTFWGRCLL